MWDKETQQFAHPTGVIVLTRTGGWRVISSASSTGRAICATRSSRPRQGKVGTPVDALLLYCFHYDPTTGRYGVAIMRTVRLAGAATVLAIGSFIVVMVRKERQAARRLSHPARGNA